MMEADWKQVIGLEGVKVVLILLLVVPGVLGEVFIDTNMDNLYLEEEGVEFFVRVANPGPEGFEGRLLVEIIGKGDDVKLLEEKIALYSERVYLKTLQHRLGEGSYKLRIELKDAVFERVIEQELIAFEVVEDCVGHTVCDKKGAYLKCEVCRGGGSNAFFWVFGGIIGVGFVLFIYFELRRKMASK
tara:strand:- start:61 stop:621 length:561 start_codon:yes stop_codon:yes gene_type:complete